MILLFYYNLLFQYYTAVHMNYYRVTFDFIMLKACSDCLEYIFLFCLKEIAKYNRM